MGKAAVDDILKNATTTQTKRSINSYLGVPEEWPVVDKLKHGLVLLLSAADVRRAKRQDPRACALHNCAVRTLRVPNCAIGAMYSYIPLRDAKGRPYIARLMATAETKKAISHFDKTGEMPAGGFVFVPVAKTKTLEHIRKYDRAYPRNLSSASERKRWQESKRAAQKKFRSKPQRAIPRVFTEDEK